MEQEQKKNIITIAILVLILILLLIFSKPILNQIHAYRENVQAEAEEQCAQDDAPYWCNL